MCACVRACMCVHAFMCVWYGKLQLNVGTCTEWQGNMSLKNVNFLQSSHFTCGVQRRVQRVADAAHVEMETA